MPINWNLNANPTAYTTAQALVKLDMSVIPVHADKVAAIGWKYFQYRRPNQSHLYEWFAKQSHQNLAVICGQVSRLILVAAKEAWLECSLFQPVQEQPTVANQLAQIVADFPGLYWLYDDITTEGPIPPAFEHLSEIKAETLIVVGERDVRDFHEIATIMERELPDAQSITLSNVGHMSNMEDSQGFNATVLKFLLDN